MELRAELEKRLMARIDPGLADMLDAPFAGDWKPLTAEETGVLLATVSIQLAMKGCDAPWPLAHETLALRGVSLPSHGRAVYVDAVLRDRAGGLGRAGFVVRDEGVTPLDTSSAPIHDFNTACPPDLTDREAAFAYLRLFCWTVCGEEGPFCIIEERNQLPAESRLGTLPAAPLEARRVEPSMKADDILWEVDGFVLYGSALFGATFQLAADGQIEMTDDNPIAELMPAPPGWRMAGHVKYLVPAGETPC